MMTQDDQMVEAPKNTGRDPSGAQPMPGITCPVCASVDTRASRKKGWAAMFMRKLLHMTRFRCRTCGKRFFA